MVEKIAKDTYKIRSYANVYLITKPVPTIIDTGKKERVKQIKKH